MTQLRASLFSLALLFVATTSCFAQAITFANFNSQVSQTVKLTYTDNGDTLAQLSGVFQGFFNPSVDFTNNAQMVAPAFTGAPVAATFTFSTITSTVNASLAGTSLTQPFTSSTGLLTITANAPINGLTVLLQMVYNGNFSGTLGSSTGNMSGGTPTNTVNFTSQFVSFVDATDRAFAVSIGSINPQVALTGNFMDSWTSRNVTGQFDAEIRQVAEPSTLALLGSVVVGTYYVQRRRKLKAAKEAQLAAAAAKAALPAIA